MKVGLYFGTFNPIHVGHIIIANHLVEYSDLDEVWMVVTPHNPHKKKSSLLANHHRFELVYLALQKYTKIKPSDIEFKLPQPNYTVNTLAHINEKYPQHEFSLIMGEDNLKSFHKWKNYDVILENHTIYCYPRISNGEIKSKLENHPKIHKIDAPIIEISATLIRQGIKNNKNVAPMLSVETWKYIDEMNFYRK
ncbi:MAG: nicotinate-nucleotide adenylyltransferase [Flavobacterium sp.]|jgi:nicotinate-nucleotide adenylyltransferase|nr:nicotinate-nucleotide adenylyltransferase [Flavobacterium sp.]